MSFDPRKTRKHVADLDRRNEALKLWYGGMTYEAIAEELGYSDRSSAWNAVQTAKKHLPDEAAEARSQAFNRIIGPLMAMREQAMPREIIDPETGEPTVVPGDPAAASAHRQYEERVSKMYGIDAPAKAEISGKDGSAITLTFAEALKPQPFQEAEYETGADE